MERSARQGSSFRRGLTGKFLYLVQAEDRFKVGYTTTPYKRFSVYKAHNPSFTVVGVYRVPDKSYERRVHWELMRRSYRRCPNSREWFFGSMTDKELDAIVRFVQSFYTAIDDLKKL